MRAVQMHQIKMEPGSWLLRKGYQFLQALVSIGSIHYNAGLISHGHPRTILAWSAKIGIALSATWPTSLLQSKFKREIAIFYREYLPLR